MERLKSAEKHSLREPPPYRARVRIVIFNQSQVGVLYRTFPLLGLGVVREELVQTCKKSHCKLTPLVGEVRDAHKNEKSQFQFYRWTYRTKMRTRPERTRRRTSLCPSPCATATPAVVPSVDSRKICTLALRNCNKQQNLHLEKKVYWVGAARAIITRGMARHWSFRASLINFLLFCITGLF
jgi:hypothetical protein